MSRTGMLGSPLARRLTVSIILVSTAITLILSFVQLYGTYRKELAGIESELAQIERVHLKALSQSVWAANKKDIALQLEGLVQTPHIEYVAIREGNKLWQQAGELLSDNIIERQFPLTYEYRNKPQRIGTLTVVSDLNKIYSHLISEATGILLRNGLKTFLVAAFMLWFFHQQVNRHLIRITNHLEGLDIEATPQALVLPRNKGHQHDEFDILADVINGMQQKIRQVHQELAANNQKIHSIADYTIDWESWFDPQGNLIWVNPSVTRMTGYTPEECYVMAEFPLPIVASVSDQQRLRDALQVARGEKVEENIEFRIRHKDGRQISMAISWQPIYGAEGEFNGFRSSVRDITYLKQVENDLNSKIRQLKQAEEKQSRLLTLSQEERARMSSLLAAMNIGILFEDTGNRVMYVNPTFRRIWLIPESIDLENRNTRDVLEHSTNVLARPDQFSRHVLQVLDSHEVSDTFEIPMADGRIVTQAYYAVHDQAGRFIGRLWVYEDVTHERQTAEQLIYLAERDSLTGLYNRHRFQEELSRMLAASTRRDTYGALLFFDLDEFKHINDSFGHRAGDSVLTRVAGEINALIRHNEIFSRIGGDEFAILMPDATKEHAIALAERVIRTTAQIPFSFEGQNFRLTNSLGIALYPHHGTNTEELVAHADTAMYLAKDAGKNAWRVYDFDQDTSREMLHRMSWNDRISNALDKDLFKLYFQGIYQASNKQLCHLEALIRLRDENDPETIIMPGHFIPAAEKTGKILDIDRWVIRESIKQLAQHLALPAIAVNISGRSFDDPQLPHYISEQLSKFSVDPSRLMVELTETAAVSDIYDAQRFIDSLRQTGCQVCLDDFGSGFSSFAYLKHLRADILKIDGLFIRDLPNDHDNQVFVKSIVDVARGLNKRTVAEFVEDAQTLELLVKFGVDLVQGYHLGVPQADHPALRQQPKQRRTA